MHNMSLHKDIQLEHGRLISAVCIRGLRDFIVTFVMYIMAKVKCLTKMGFCLLRKIQVSEIIHLNIHSTKTVVGFDLGPLVA